MWNFLLVMIVSMHLGQSLKLPYLPEIKTKGYSKGGVCESTVSALIEQFRFIMPIGSETLGIPVLEPFTKKYTDVDVDHEVGNMTGVIQDLKIEYLSKFNTTSIECKYIILLLQNNIHINVTIPYLELTGLYDIEGMAMEMIPMYGKGPFSINITNLDVGLIISIRGSAQNISLDVKKIRIWAHMERSDIYFKELLYGDKNEPSLEEKFNRMFTELGPIALEDLWDDLEPYIVNQIMEKLESRSKETPISSFVSYMDKNIKIHKDRVFNFSRTLLFGTKNNKN